jgi:hypothetical protein
MAARAEQEPKPKLSLEIRIGESTLYDHAPGMRAVLKEIAIMTSSPGSEKKPKSDGFDAGWNWAGWCWPQEKTLAGRTGNCERLVRKAVHRFQADSVVEIRSWRDRSGRPHNAYRIREEVIDAARRKPGEDRKRRSDRKANATSYKSHRNAESHRNACPIDVATESHRNAEPAAIGTLSHEPQEREPRKPQELDAVEVGLVRGGCIEVCEEGGVRGESSSQTLTAEEQHRAPKTGAPFFPDPSPQIQQQEQPQPQPQNLPGEVEEQRQRQQQEQPPEIDQPTPQNHFEPGAHEILAAYPRQSGCIPILDARAALERVKQAGLSASWLQAQVWEFGKNPGGLVPPFGTWMRRNLERLISAASAVQTDVRLETGEQNDELKRAVESGNVATDASVERPREGPGRAAGLD